MALQVVTGAELLCSLGLGTGKLISAQAAVAAGGNPAATIQDSAAFLNITPCGMCTTQANPAVAAATAAALGVPTPAPCVPSPVGVWSCGSNVLLGGVPALLNNGQLQCAYGGTLTIVSPGQGAVLIS